MSARLCIIIVCARVRVRVCCLACSTHSWLFGSKREELHAERDKRVKNFKIEKQTSTKGILLCECCWRCNEYTSPLDIPTHPLQP